MTEFPDHVHVQIPRDLAERLAKGEVYVCKLEWIDVDNAELVVTADPELATDPELA